MNGKGKSGVVLSMSKRQRLYCPCACGNYEHTLCFERLDDPGDVPDIQILLCLNRKGVRFRTRLKLGIKYILGLGSECSIQDLILERESWTDIQDFISKAIDDYSAWVIAHAKPESSKSP